MGLQACTAGKRITARSQLQFLGVYELPYQLEFAGTVVGGLSGIDYNREQNQYYLISDDRSDINPPRFYTAKINVSEKGIDTAMFLQLHYLHNRQNLPFPPRKSQPSSAPDPEAIRYDVRHHQLIWSSEGERSFKSDTVLQNPFLQRMDTSGQFIHLYPTPARYRVHLNEQGVRHNGSWEGLSFANNFQKIWLSMEEPLYEDGSRSTANDAAWVRFLVLDASSQKHEAEYAYRIDPVAHAPAHVDSFHINGIPEILWVKNHELLVLERSFTAGRSGCVVKIYLADFSAATDVKHMPSLTSQSFISAKKTLLLDMRTLPVPVYNVEGICFGPRLPNGKQSLMLVADDNFSTKDKTQFFLFSIEN
jgi:hypothetical protein